MSRLQAAGDYLREIAELERMIALEEQFNEELGTDAASLLTIESLRNRLRYVTEEMERLGDDGMPQQEIAVVFDGKPVAEHSVDVDFLGTMLHSFQRVMKDVLASTVGAHGRRGKRRKEVNRRSALRFAGSFPGSFGMVLETTPEELALNDAGSIANAIDLFVRLVDSGSEEGTILEGVAALNPRARESYSGLLDQLGKSRASMQVSWTTALGERSARISAKAAERVVSRMRRVQTKEWLRSYTGKLDGGFASKALFAFITDDGERMEGRVSSFVAERLSEFHFEQTCIAQIFTREVRDEMTGDVKYYHQLEDLQPRQVEPV